LCLTCKKQIDYQSRLGENKRKPSLRLDLMLFFALDKGEEKGMNREREKEKRKNNSNNFFFSSSLLLYLVAG